MPDSHQLWHTHSRTHTNAQNCFFCRAARLMFPRLQLPQGQLTQSVPPPSRSPPPHHSRPSEVTSPRAPPPTPLSCFNGTSRAAEAQKTRTYMRTFPSKSQSPHASSPASAGDQTDLPSHARFTTLLASPVINHLPGHHPWQHHTPPAPPLSSHRNIPVLSAHWHPRPSTHRGHNRRLIQYVYMCMYLPVL